MVSSRGHAAPDCRYAAHAACWTAPTLNVSSLEIWLSALCLQAMFKIAAEAMEFSASHWREELSLN